MAVVRVVMVVIHVRSDGRETKTSFELLTSYHLSRG